MALKATVTCGNGHGQVLHYGAQYDKEYVESHCVILCGGYLAAADVKMIGQTCDWAERGILGTIGRCGAPFTALVEDDI